MTILEELQRQAWETQQAKGFEEGPQNIDQKLLLVVGEIAEAHNVLRAGYAPTVSFMSEDGTHAEGFLVELADAVLRILNIASAVGATPEQFAQVLRDKNAYNATRPYKHGKAF